MTWRKDVSLDKYGIDENRYRELRYFCLQYCKWKNFIEADPNSIHARSYDLPKLKGTKSDPTGEEAIRRADFQRNCALIEKTAQDVGGLLYAYLMIDVTEDVRPTEQTYLPCGRRQYYEIRRRFFHELDKRKGA